MKETSDHVMGGQTERGESVVLGVSWRRGRLAGGPGKTRGPSVGRVNDFVRGGGGGGRQEQQDGIVKQRNMKWVNKEHKKSGEEIK